jgi:hypothetical protein
MKKLVWFVKVDDKKIEVSLKDLIGMTSKYNSLKITEYDIDNETHKVVEFKK